MAGGDLTGRRVVPAGLTGLAGAACVACCAIPLLLAAGVLGGAGWAAAGWIMPGVAVGLVAAAGSAWWWLARRRPAGSCASGAGGACDEHAGDGGAVTESAEGASVRSSA